LESERQKLLSRIGNLERELGVSNSALNEARIEIETLSRSVTGLQSNLTSAQDEIGRAYNTQMGTDQKLDDIGRRCEDL
jgi:chromosome segregation ATPase